MSTREIAALRSELEVLRLRVQVLEERLSAREAERPSPLQALGLRDSVWSLLLLGRVDTSSLRTPRNGLSWPRSVEDS